MLLCVLLSLSAYAETTSQYIPVIAYQGAHHRDLSPPKCRQGYEEARMTLMHEKDAVGAGGF